MKFEPHRVAITPPELRLEVGKTATLNCSVFGNPSGSVIWRKDMMTLLPNPRIIFPNPYLLQVRQIRRQDAGMYQCFVQRELYSSQAAARIIIGDHKFSKEVLMRVVEEKNISKEDKFYNPLRIM
ncbi:ig-like domain-containing protein [Trichonephila clavata]|uniref:Ig-like domain-containing protein n=1 Tax=Trichonephila clavata TaxID=2740835 RepID=A0A8X6ID55_TRICU|nr:ig-like domain-containing protein [Trichonephila clavata]